MGYISKLDLSVISNKNIYEQSNISNISNFNTLVKAFRDNYKFVNYNSDVNFNGYNSMQGYLYTHYKGNLTSFGIYTPINAFDINNADSFKIHGLISYYGREYLITSEGLLLNSNDYWVNSGKYSFNNFVYYDIPIFITNGDGIYYGDGINNDSIKLVKSNSYSTGSFTKIILTPDCKTYIVGGTGTTTPGLYYSTNNGKTWSASNITTGICNGLSNIGEKTIAFMSNGIYYTTNNGKSWTQFSGMTGFSTGYQVTDNLIVAFVAGKGFYTYKNGGSFTLTQTSEASLGTSISGKFNVIRNTRLHDQPYVIIYGLGTSGLWYSEDYGKTYTKSNITTGEFISIKVFGQTALAVDYTNKVLYYSNDCGKTWNKVTGSEGTTSIASIDAHLGITDKIIIGGTYGVKHINVSNQFSLTDEAQRAYNILYSQTSWKNEDIVNNSILSDAFLKFLGYYPSISPNVLPPNINSSTPICYNGTTNVYRGQTGNNAVIKWNDKVKDNYDSNGVLKLGNAPYFDFAEKYSTKPRTYIEYGGGRITLSKAELVHRFNEVMKHNIRELYKLTTLINPETGTPYIIEKPFTTSTSGIFGIDDLSGYDYTQLIVSIYPDIENINGTTEYDTVNHRTTFDVLFDNYVNMDKEFTIHDMINTKNELYSPYPFNSILNINAVTNYVLRNRGFFTFINNNGKDGLSTSYLYHQDTLLVFLYRILRSKQFEGIINLIAPFDINKKYTIRQTSGPSGYNYSKETDKYGLLYFSKPEEFDYLPYY